MLRPFLFQLVADQLRRNTLTLSVDVGSVIVTVDVVLAGTRNLK